MENGAYGYMDQREKGKSGGRERERRIDVDIRKEEKRMEEWGKKWRDERN